MLTLGIDDAGRGPVIGPMILAGCLLTDSAAKQLKKLGVRDSKQLTAKRRELLVGKIKELAESYFVVIVTATEIDGNGGERIKLNELEAHAAAKIINKLNKGEKKIKVVVDCPSTSLIKWADYLKTKIKTLSTMELSCEHKADQNHVSVSAGSILAKSTREKEMDKLKKKYGDEIGSGYTSDPTTIKFLQKYVNKYENEGIFRKTWETYKRAKLSKSQKKLF